MTVVRIDQAGVVHDTEQMAIRRLAEDHLDAGPILAILLGLRPAWQADAACAEHDADLWFPERGRSTDEAKAICDSCLVKEECLSFAIENGEKHGIWGGASERQRRRLRAGVPFGTPAEAA